MRRLLVLRHAKSSWANAGVGDRDRALNKRGKAAAPAMGRYMAEQSYIPGHVLCSPARRARDTLALVLENISRPVPFTIENPLYDFSSGDSYARVIARKGADVQTLMIVGHNPSIEGLCNRLCTTGDRKMLAAMDWKYPTAALAVIDFDIKDWGEMAWNTGHLVTFTRPRDLMDGE